MRTARSIALSQIDFWFGGMPLEELEEVGEAAGELHDEMMVIGAQVLLETVNTIGAGQAQAIDQQEIIKQVGEIKHAPKIFKDDCEINWSLPVDAVHDFIRGLAPYPAAWTTLNQKQFKILKGSKTVIQAVTPGEIHTDLKNFIRISSVDFQYEIHELQMQGKKKMSTTDFLRGNSSVFES